LDELPADHDKHGIDPDIEEKNLKELGRNKKPERHEPCAAEIGPERPFHRGKDRIHKDHNKQSIQNSDRPKIHRK